MKILTAAVGATALRQLGLPLTLVGLGLALTAPAQAAVIGNGNVVLGVDDYGQLNAPGVVPDVVGEYTAGVRWVDSGGQQYEATAHGCLCEGWGLMLANDDGTYSGSANNAYGVYGIDLIGFSSTATTAQSVTRISGTDVQITHDFGLAAETDNLYRVNVTITNGGSSAATGLVYRRVMDWDTSPTPFEEFVTIKGTGSTTLLADSTNDGFSSADPLTPLGGSGCGPNGTDFDACGPSDHGAGFDFALDDLDVGESYTFSIFFGGAANRADALAALGLVGAELYSMGWSGQDTDQDGLIDGTSYVAPTFLFAFSGVGGEVIEPPPPGATIPLPAAGWLLMAGIGALGAMGRRRAARKA